MWLSNGENLATGIGCVDRNRREVVYCVQRKAISPGAFTQNEWFKAQRFKDAYYLYAVMNAATLP